MPNQEKSRNIAAVDFDAVIFDLDGVVTDTASVHAAAWKSMFNDFLQPYAAARRIPFQPFDADAEYRRHVDGKPRLDGVRDFLKSRNIHLPEGSADDPPGRSTIHGLGNLKNIVFLKKIEEKGPDIFQSTVALIDQLKRHGLKTAIISSSKNCAMILKVAGLQHLFDVKVDGIDSETIGIAGKPAPDIFLEAARRLNVVPSRTVVVEDAVSGVQAGRAGKFGLVIGIARSGDSQSLRQNGADLVVLDLSEISSTGPDQARTAVAPQPQDP